MENPIHTQEFWEAWERSKLKMMPDELYRMAGVNDKLAEALKSWNQQQGAIQQPQAPQTIVEAEAREQRATELKAENIKAKRELRKLLLGG